MTDVWELTIAGGEEVARQAIAGKLGELFKGGAVGKADLLTALTANLAWFVSELMEDYEVPNLPEIVGDQLNESIKHYREEYE